MPSHHDEDTDFNLRKILSAAFKADSLASYSSYAEAWQRYPYSASLICGVT